MATLFAGAELEHLSNEQQFTDNLIFQNMNDLDEFFSATAQTVDVEVDSLIDSASIESVLLREAMRWSLFGGGKRFRPALVFAVGETLSVPRERLIRLASAVEMIHTYSLIHDDLPAMDDDDLRRGRETCHKKFDEATAVLAGDALHVLAFEAIANDNGLSVDLRLRLISGLGEAARKMVVGQQLDLEAEGTETTADKIKQIHARKTGALIGFSATGAGMVAEAGDNVLESIARFASRLGHLFQISDDILDVTQSTATLGKTAAKDVSAGKATYPGTLGLAASENLLGEVYESSLSALRELSGRTQILADFAKYVYERKS